MSVQEDYVSIFNKTVVEFMDFMSNNTDNKEKISEYKKLYVGMSIISPKIPIEKFMEGMEPFGVQIISEDENFFKTQGYVNEAKNFTGEFGLEEMWDSTSKEFKQNVWKYIKVLYTSGMKVIGKEEDLKNVISTVYKG